MPPKGRHISRISPIGPIRRNRQRCRSKAARDTAVKNAERQTLKADRSAQSRELAPTGPFGFWLEKILGGCCYSFLSPVLDKLSIHTGFVISVFICSQLVSGFVFFDSRETYLAAVMPLDFLCLCQPRFLTVSRGVISIGKFFPR